MKKTVCIKIRSICVGLCIAGIMGILSAGVSHARELCRGQIDCLPDFDGQTVYVDYDAVMLSEVLEHCAPTVVAETDTTPDTISLFIVIDHSSSMSVMDPTSKRYLGASDLIDSIAQQSPVSEIGIVVFSNKLLYNADDDSFFKKMTNSQDWNDAYVPLTKLNSQVGGMSAVEKLKWAIEVDPSTKDMGNNYTLVNGNYNNSGRNSYTGTTDISLAFEAAREAFQSATYAKKRQYMVLFSDGIAQNVDAARESYLLDYIDGKTMPTTFTAFFVNTGQPIPNEIKNMTTNIKNNGYSTTNVNSDVWRTQGEINEFFGKILGTIIGGIKIYTSTPVSLTVNGVTTTQFDSTDAFFSPPFAPLDKNGELTLNISYTYHWDAPLDKDTTAEYTVYVKQSNNPDVASVDCWNQGRLTFVHDGAEITNARPDQLTLDIRFFPPDSGNIPPIRDTFDLEITNADRTDKLTLTMVKESLGRWYEATFDREYNTPISDGILQNLMVDSIVAIYRNPDIPLDTVYHAIKVQPQVDMDVTFAYYLDKDADGHPDEIGTIQSGGGVNTQDECDIIKEYMDITGPRKIIFVESVKPSTYGLTITIPEPDPSSKQEPFTALYYDKNDDIDEMVSIQSVGLPSGQTFPLTLTEIQDSMAPVILKGKYCPGFTKKEGETVKDTLIVTFSEPVKTPTNNEPFYFLDLSVNDPTTKWHMKLTPVEKKDGTKQSFLVESLNPQWNPESGDSIWINYEADVKDVLLNIQDNENNRKAPLTVKPYLFNITVTAGPNPSTPEDLDTVFITDGLSEQKKGMVIKAKVVGSWVSHIDLEGKLVIFDMVGNQVQELEGEAIDDDEKKDGIKETVVFVWDGTTGEYHRKVGSGAYVGIVSVNSVTGTGKQDVTRNARIMLGIKREVP